MKSIINVAIRKQYKTKQAFCKEHKFDYTNFSKVLNRFETYFNWCNSFLSKVNLKLTLTQIEDEKLRTELKQMGLKEAIIILENHNEWRRCNEMPSSIVMAKPKELGIAIDTVVREFGALTEHVVVPRVLDFKNVGGESVDPDHVELMYEDGEFKFYEADCHQKIQEVFPVYEA